MSFKSIRRRVLVCHPKSIADNDLAAFVLDVQSAFDGLTLRGGVHPLIEIYTARDEATAMQVGRERLPFNWTAYVAHVTGIVGDPPEPRFHYYVVGPERTIGKATAQLLIKAKNAGRQIFALDDHAKLATVRNVRETGGEDNWKAFAEVII